MATTVRLAGRSVNFRLCHEAVDDSEPLLCDNLDCLVPIEEPFNALVVPAGETEIAFFFCCECLEVLKDGSACLEIGHEPPDRF